VITSFTLAVFMLTFLIGLAVMGWTRRRSEVIAEREALAAEQARWVRVAAEAHALEQMALEERRKIDLPWRRTHIYQNEYGERLEGLVPPPPKPDPNITPWTYK
jgi:hypothetical protein